MGLKKALSNLVGGAFNAATGSVGSVLADQWKEFFYCDAMDSDVLVCKGQKRTSDRTSNKKGSDNIISNGSVIVVNEGQCMMIIEQGKIVDVCAEAGEYVYDSSTEPSIFAGSLGESIKATFKTIGKRFTFGGDTGKDQRVYYFNTKEISGNKYGTPTPVPFRVVDSNIGLDVDITIRCNGEYSYKMVNPLLFYTNVCGNVEDVFTRDQIDRTLKNEILNSLQAAFAKISDMGIRYYSLPGHTEEISNALNEVLSKKWSELRGLAVFSFGVNSVTAPKEDEDMIKQLQKTAVMRNPGMAAATLTEAQADAMRAAASNDNGAMMGFMGLNMAQNAGGLNANNLFQMGQQQQVQQPQMGQPAPQQAAPQQTASTTDSGWTCSCGATGNTGKFCMECGKPKPEDNGWTCSCGAVNKGKFCMECGKPKPAGAKLYKCDKCNWEPEDPANPPKFCPQCGDQFNDNDVQ